MTEKLKRVVCERYAEAVKQGGCCPTPAGGCCVAPAGDCGGARPEDAVSRRLGYSDDELKAVPQGANLGLGCGNPTAFASLREGEVVLDLGSGAGVDCFLAARMVGETGRVIGVDMTPEMILRARENAEKGDYRNVEFRLGEIEHLPVADSSVDVAISNCVINLVPDKRMAFKEAFRALRPGGRLMVSDIVLLGDLPDFIKNSMEAYVGCIAGAAKRDDYLEYVKAAGFQDVKIVEERAYPAEGLTNDPAVNAAIENADVSMAEVEKIAGLVVGIGVHGVKPSRLGEV